MRSRARRGDLGPLAADEVAEGLPHLIALDGAERLAPRVEAFQRNARMREGRQVVDHEFQRRAQQVGDVAVGFGEGVLQHDHASEARRDPPLVEQYGADLAEYTGTVGEPARHVERRRHGLHAGKIDAAERWPQTVQPVERCRNAH